MVELEIATAKVPCGIFLLGDCSLWHYIRQRETGPINSLA